jgi:hypothetical protein
VTITVTFDVWVAAVSVYLDRLQCPRPLAEMPAGIESALATWFRRGVRAYAVARALTAVCWPGRATLNADPLVPNNRRRVLAEVRERLAA